MKQKIRIAVVDPIISSSYFATELKKHDVETIAIFTLNLNLLTDHEREARFHPELFDHTFFLKDYKNLQALAEALRPLNIDFLCSGFEESVAYTDQLNAILQLPYANDPKTSHHRSNKYEMLSQLKASNIPTVKQFKITGHKCTEEVLQNFKDWQFPAIIKPSNGSGSAGITIVNNIEDVKLYLQNVPAYTIGRKFEEFLVQELLTGTEYVVDTLSILGKHQVISVYRYHKILVESKPIYRYAEIVHPQTAEYKLATDYAAQVLTAVGLLNGFGHTEIFLTPQGPRLIEVNPRIAGASGLPHKLTQALFKTNQIAALSFFLKHKQLDIKNYLPQGYGRFLLIQNWQPRVIGNVDIAKLQNLSSYKEILVLKPAGTYLEKPKDLGDVVLLVLFINQDKEQLEKDTAQVFMWEQEQMLF
jgi:biotin carboxylase